MNFNSKLVFQIISLGNVFTFFNEEGDFFVGKGEKKYVRKTFFFLKKKNNEMFEGIFPTHLNFQFNLLRMTFKIKNKACFFIS